MPCNATPEKNLSESVLFPVLNRKLKTMVRRGLLCAWPKKTAITQKPAPPRLKKKEVCDVPARIEPVTEILLSHAQEKREALFEREEEEQVTVDDLPRAQDGWRDVRPVGDPELLVDRVLVARTQGECKKFFHVTVTRASVKKRRTRAKKMLQRIRREDREAAKKQAKRQARLFMALLGK